MIRKLKSGEYRLYSRNKDLVAHRQIAQALGDSLVEDEPRVRSMNDCRVIPPAQTINVLIA